eukprot:CAMPEP_0114560644 /NCGR_PEP_ID=MMETSP0114-20121206/11567_1 /TAXON_ID=31324 /ORGANISM="Goniomonas sp, Strain m" /LENGTH=211 /DNA_ID=CAMNT_0001746199 /DNA_START=8 /DNA_END=640 /DNA_ORIENTATION=-
MPRATTRRSRESLPNSEDSRTHAWLQPKNIATNMSDATAQIQWLQKTVASLHLTIDTLQTKMSLAQKSDMEQLDQLRVQVEMERSVSQTLRKQVEQMAEQLEQSEQVSQELAEELRREVQLTNEVKSPGVRRRTNQALSPKRLGLSPDQTNCQHRQKPLDERSKELLRQEEYQKFRLLRQRQLEKLEEEWRASSPPVSPSPWSSNNDSLPS